MPLYGKILFLVCPFAGFLIGFGLIGPRVANMSREQRTQNTEHRTQNEEATTLPFVLPLHYNCAPVAGSNFEEHQIVDAHYSWLIGRLELKDSSAGKTRAAIFKGIVAAANKAL